LNGRREEERQELRVTRDYTGVSHPREALDPEARAGDDASVDFDRLLDVLRALEAQGAEYVLVGGVAMGLHGLVRATQDIDLFVRPSAANVAKVKAALRAVWDDPAIDEITADDLAGDYPTIRYGPPGETLVVDLIGRLSDAIRFEDLAAERKLVEGVAVSVATPATLYRMKRDTVRPIDRQDAAALRDTFGLEG